MRNSDFQLVYCFVDVKEQLNSINQRTKIFFIPSKFYFRFPDFMLFVFKFINYGIKKSNWIWFKKKKKRIFKLCNIKTHVDVCQIDDFMIWYAFGCKCSFKQLLRKLIITILYFIFQQ